MQRTTRTGYVRAVVGTANAAFLALAMSSVMVSSAQATPEMAKGKKCDTCHSAMPPTKDNAKKADTKKK